jgi:hypothetical protein
MKNLLLLLLISLFTFQLYATPKSSVAGTVNWNTAASWSPSGVPGSGDAVTIVSGSTVTVDISNAACLSLSVGPTTGSGTGQLQFNNGAVLTVSGSVTLNDGGSRHGYLVMNSGGTIQISGSFTDASSQFTCGKGTVEYNGASQTILAETYHNLTLSGSGTDAAGGNLVVDTLTVSSGIILNMSSNTLSGPLSLISNSGTISTTNTSSTPIPTGKSWGGTVNYAATSGSQTIMSGTYNILTLSNTSGTNTASGNLTITTLTTTAGGTLNMGSNTLGLTSITNAGTISTANTSSTPISTGKTWGGTVIYAAASGLQTVMAGTYNILNLTNTSGTNTASGNIATTTLNNSGGGILDMGVFTLTGAITNASSSTIRFSGATNGLAITTGTIDYYGAGQTVAGGTYANLKFSNISGTNTANGNLTVTGTFTTTASGILDMSTFTLTVATVANNGTIKTSSTTNPPFTSGKTWLGTIEYVTSGQSVPAGTYNNLQFDNSSGTNTAVGNLAMTGTLTTTSGGTLNMNTFSLTGTVVVNGGTIKTSSTANPPLPSGETWGGTIEYAVLTGGQYIPAGTYSTLQLDNTSGSNTIVGSITVNGTLNGGTTSGITIGANLTLTLSSSTGNQCGSISYSTVNQTLTYAGTSYLNCGTITYGASGCIINFTGTGTINCSGSAAFASSSGNQLNVGTGTFICTGTIGQASCSSSTISCTSGSITCLNITLGSSTTVSYGSGTINVNGAFTYGSSLTWTPGTGVINYSGGAQTVLGLTYTNLTLSGTGAKNTTGVTVTGILTIAGDATVSLSTPPTFGGSSTIQYQGSASRTATINEFPNAFAGTGGVIIDQGAGNSITLNANKTALAGNLYIKSGTLDLSTYTINRISNTLTLTIAGTLKLAGISGGQTGSNFPTGFTTLTMTGGTVDYNAASGGQTVYSTPTYNNLTLENTSGNTTAGGNLTVSSTLTTTAGGTLDMSTFTLTAATVTNNGTIKTSNSSSTPIPTGRTWGGTVNYALAGGSQTVMAGTYNVLTLSNTSGTNTASGNLATTTLNNTGGGILDLVGYTLTGSITNSASSTIRFNGATNGIAVSTGTIDYYGTGQTVAAGTYNNLKLSNASGTNTAGGNLTVSSTLTTTASGTLDMSTFTLTAATVTNNGTLSTTNTSSTPLPTGKTWGGTVIYAAASGLQTIMSGTYNILNLTNTSGTNTASGNLATTTLNNSGGGILDMVGFTLTGAITNASTSWIRFNGVTNGMAVTTGTIDYYGTGQTVAGGTYNNLKLSNTSGTNTAGSNLIVNGTFTTTAGGTLNLGSNTLSGSLTSITNGGTINSTNTSSTPLPTGKTWGGAIVYAAATGSQAVMAGTYNILTLSNTSGTNTASGNLIVNNSLNTAANGTLDMSTFTLSGTLSSVNNGIIKTSNTSANPIPAGLTWGGTVNYSGASSQSINNGIYSTLNINNSAGVTLTGDATVNTTLNFTSGKITTGANKVILGSSASVSGAGAGKYIYGNLLCNISTGTPNKTFTIGDASNYAPVSVAFTNVTVAGTLTGSVTGADHSLISTSGINPSKSVNHAWTLTNTGIAFSSGTATVTLNWVGVGTDADAGSTPANYIVAKLDGSTWTNPSLGAKTSTSIVVNGITSFSDFQVGEAATNPTDYFRSVTSGVWSAVSTWQSSSDNSTWVPSVLSPTNLAHSITIQNPHTVSVDVDGQTASSIIIAGTLANTASNNLNVSGNWTNNGSFTPVTGTVIFSGTTQTINGSASTTFNNLTLSNSGLKTLSTIPAVNGTLSMEGTATASAAPTYGGSAILQYKGSGSQTTGAELPSNINNLTINKSNSVALSGSTIVSGTFALTSGYISLGSNNLTVNSISGGSSTSYIITDGTGTLVQNVGPSPVTFPVGFVASDYTPITFSNTGTSQNYFVRVRYIFPDDRTGGLYRQWFVQESIPSSTRLSSLGLAWTINSIGTLLDPNPCDIVENFTGDNAPYQKIYGGLDGSSLSVTTPTLNYFPGNLISGVFITVVGLNNALPVELSSFTSAVNGRNINLNWETKTEKNSDKFTVERSNNGATWVTVGSVKASDLSNSAKQYTFTDKNLQTGKYQYRLMMVDNDGSFMYSKVIETEVSTPKNFVLSQNYPNPFNPSTRIDYQLPIDAKVSLEVYNIVGQRVAVIVNEEQSAGYYTVNFNASSYRNFTSGVYIYKLTSEDHAGKNSSSIKKMMLLK